MYVYIYVRFYVDVTRASHCTDYLVCHVISGVVTVWCCGVLRNTLLLELLLLLLGVVTTGVVTFGCPLIYLPKCVCACVRKCATCVCVIFSRSSRVCVCVRVFVCVCRQ